MGAYQEIVRELYKNLPNQTQELAPQVKNKLLQIPEAALPYYMGKKFPPFELWSGKKITFLQAYQKEVRKKPKNITEIKRNLLLVPTPVVQLFVPDPKYDQPKPLANLGNTCYLNALIQCLYNIDYLTYFCLLAHESNYYDKKGSIPDLYINLVYGLRSSQKGIDLKELQPFASKFSSVIGKGKRWNQEDATEAFSIFLRYFWKEDTRYPNLQKFDFFNPYEIHPLGKVIKITTEDIIKRIRLSTATPTITTLPIEASRIADTGWLDMHIQDGQGKIFTTLQQCFDSFFQEGEIDYTPGSHQEGDYYTKQFKILELSDIVLIGLKRYYTIGGTSDIPFYPFKIIQSIKIPFEINFNPYYKEPPQTTSIYNLTAFAQHIGGGIRVGHYVAYVKKANQWYKCNDSRISKVSNIKEVQEAANLAYFFVYKKRYL